MSSEERYIPLSVYKDLINTIECLFVSLRNGDTEETRFTLLFLKDKLAEVKDNEQKYDKAQDTAL